MSETTKSLNENERKALGAIIDTCDEIDGEGFTRQVPMMLAVMKVFDNNGQRAGGYIADLINKNLIMIEPTEDEVWVMKEAMEAFC